MSRSIPEEQETAKNFLAVEYMVVSNCMFQKKLQINARKLAIVRMLEQIEKLQAEIDRDEAQKARVFRHLAANDQAFISGYDMAGKSVEEIEQELFAIA